MSNKYVAEVGHDKLQLFKYIIEAAWEHNNDISIDEKNLLEKIRIKLGITNKEYQIIEAKINKFPQHNNITHNKTEINEVRKYLQSKGIIIPIRDSYGIDYDIIPSEIAMVIRKLYNIELKTFGYKQLINHKYIKNKSYYLDILNNSGINVTSYMTIPQLQDLIIERVSPSNLLGGYSLKDGLDKNTLYQWCVSLDINSSGTKSELIQKIIKYYDNIKQMKSTF